MEPQYSDTNAVLSEASTSGLMNAPQHAPEPSVTSDVPVALQASSTADVPIAAEDSDIIEQEWVAAVKKTLELYKADPYLLSKAMTALRQDYLQKRYGKTVEAAK